MRRRLLCQKGGDYCKCDDNFQLEFYYYHTKDKTAPDTIPVNFLLYGDTSVDILPTKNINLKRDKNYYYKGIKEKYILDNEEINSLLSYYKLPYYNIPQNEFYNPTTNSYPNRYCVYFVQNSYDIIMQYQGDDELFLDKSSTTSLTKGKTLHTISISKANSFMEWVGVSTGCDPNGKPISDKMEYKKNIYGTDILTKHYSFGDNGESFGQSDYEYFYSYVPPKQDTVYNFTSQNSWWTEDADGSDFHWMLSGYQATGKGGTAPGVSPTIWNYVDSSSNVLGKHNSLTRFNDYNDTMYFEDYTSNSVRQVAWYITVHDVEVNGTKKDINYTFIAGQHGSSSGGGSGSGGSLGWIEFYNNTNLNLYFGSTGMKVSSSYTNPYGYMRDYRGSTMTRTDNGIYANDSIWISPTWVSNNSDVKNASYIDITIVDQNNNSWQLKGTVTNSHITDVLNGKDVRISFGRY